jgi:hypothetical protein
MRHQNPFFNFPLKNFACRASSRANLGKPNALYCREAFVSSFKKYFARAGDNFI